MPRRIRRQYNFFFGITCGYEGLTISPCIPKAFGDCSVRFTYLGKNFEIEYEQREEKSVIFNDLIWNFEFDDNGKIVAFFEDAVLEDSNKIVIAY